MSASHRRTPPRECWSVAGEAAVVWSHRTYRYWGRRLFHGPATGSEGRASGVARWVTLRNDEKKNEQEVSARTLQKRAAAAASRSAKRELMGEQAYLQEKLDAQQELKRRRQAKCANAATAARPTPGSVDLSSSGLESYHQHLGAAVRARPAPSAVGG